MRACQGRSGKHRLIVSEMLPCFAIAVALTADWIVVLVFSCQVASCGKLGGASC